MNIRKTLVALAFVGALCSGSFVLGQQDQTKEPTQEEFMVLLNRAKYVGTNEDYSALASAYSKAPEDPKAVFEILRVAQDREVKANSSLVLSSLQVAQNQRIIELLEKLNEKQKAK